MKLKYSIIIPTCNRHLTERCLEYLSELSKPEADYEVLVVHNANEDDIENVVKSFEGKIPNLRYIFEPTPGLLYGRHTGAKKSAGEILCYLDDDSFVDKNYLTAVEETFLDQNVLIAGGNNLPLYESAPPEWLKYFWNRSPYGFLLSDLSLINFHDKKMKIPAWFVFGCNFVIRKSALIEYGGFNPDLVPLQRFQGDGETALSCKLNRAGHPAYFNPDIKIQHLVPTSRMTLEYFQKRAFYQGVCDSFSQIRKENGFEYFDFEPHENIGKASTIIRLYDYTIIRLYDYTIKLLSLLIQKSSLKRWEYLKIKKECKKSYEEGFKFHQREVKNDPELLKWVLKENYLD